MEDGACQFRFVAPVLTRGKAAELPQPAGVGIIFKVYRARHARAAACACAEEA